MQIRFLHKGQRSTILVLLGFFLLISFTGCVKNRNNHPVDLPMRMVNQIEYYQYEKRSTSDFRYENDRIVYRDLITDLNKYRYEYEYADNEVTAFYYRGFDEIWSLSNRVVYSYESSQLQQVVYSNNAEEGWRERERWTFTYMGDLYDEILIEELFEDEEPLPAALFKYNYVDEFLSNYQVFNYANDWYQIRQVNFSYEDEKIVQVLLQLINNSDELEAYERHSYFYEQDKLVQIIVAINAGEEWIDGTEINLKYDVNGNVVEETVIAIQTGQLAYQVQVPACVRERKP